MISLNFHRTNLEPEILKKCSFSCMKCRWHKYFTRTRIQVLMLLLKASTFLVILGPRILQEKITTLLFLRSKSQCGVLEDLFKQIKNLQSSFLCLVKTFFLSFIRISLKFLLGFHSPGGETIRRLNPHIVIEYAKCFRQSEGL